MKNIDNSIICAPEIAGILKKTLATIHKYRKKGELPEPKYKLNTVYVWDRAEFFSWLDGVKKSKMNINDVSDYLEKSEDVILTYKGIGLIPKVDNQSGELSWRRSEITQNCEKLIGLVTTKEISDKTGYSVSSISKKSELPNYPKPKLIIKGCRLWKWVEIKTYFDKEMRRKNKPST